MQCSCSCILIKLSQWHIALKPVGTNSDQVDFVKCQCFRLFHSIQNIFLISLVLSSWTHRIFKCVVSFLNIKGFSRYLSFIDF